MGHALLLEIPEQLYAKLIERAKQTGQAPEALATQWLTAAVEQFADDPLEACIGALDSRGSDWADNHDTHLGSALSAGSSPAALTDQIDG